MLKRKAAQQLDDIDQVPPKRHHGTFATAVDEGASTEAGTPRGVILGTPGIGLSTNSLYVG